MPVNVATAQRAPSMRIRMRRCVSLLTASIVGLASAACTRKLDSLPNPNGSTNDQAGFSVGIDSNWAMSGVAKSDTVESNGGKVLVYERSGANWSLAQTLVSGTPVYGAQFGWSLDLSGERAIVGAFGDVEAGHISGAAYIFERSGSSWTQVARVLGDTLEAGFAYSVAISGDYAVIGAPYAPPPTFVGPGLAYVYRRNAQGAWQRDTTLGASDAVSYIEFGHSVAIDDDVIVVGALKGVQAQTIGGAAYVFRRSGSTWTQEAKLVALDPAYHDYFGRAVSVSGDTVIVGAKGDDEKGTDAGAAYLFERDTLGAWQQVKKLMPSSLTPGDEFGYAVGIDMRRAIAGAWLGDGTAGTAGAAFRYGRGTAGWGFSLKLIANNGAYGDGFGASVSLSGACAMVGAPNRDVSGATNVGASYIYCTPPPQVQEPEIDIICCWQPPIPQPVVAIIRYRNVGQARIIATRRVELVSPSGKVSEGVALRSLILSPGDSTAERVVIPMQAPLENGRYELRLRWSDDAGERIERAHFVPPARNEAALGSVRPR